jgi:hypothetical protein
MAAPPADRISGLGPAWGLRWRPPGAFDAAWYGRTYPDAAAARGGRLVHWLRHGRHEGRLPCAIAAATAEAALWAGEERARADLARLATSPLRTERIWARLALARAAAAAGDWAQAGAEIATLDPKADLVRHLGLPAPLLFCAEVARHQADAPRAEALLRLAGQAFGPFAALHLAQACHSLIPPGTDATGWAQVLTAVFAPHGLAVPLPGRAEGATPFDRLTATAGPPGTEGPLVSVIVPTRDAGAMLDTALSGLVAQSWQRLEILVVDNGSHDDTAQRLANWAARDARIRPIDGRAEPGAYGARNLGVSLATGEVITLQDADDWSHPDRIRLQLQALLATPDRVACLSFWARMTEDLCVTGIRPDVGLVHPNLSSLMLKRAAVARLGYWDQVRAGADSEYVARLIRVFGPGALGHVLPGVPLAFGRMRAGSLTQSVETGLFFGPGAAARTAYLAAAAAWHAASPAPHLPRHPVSRPFAVPAALDFPSRSQP